MLLLNLPGFNLCSHKYAPVMKAPVVWTAKPALHAQTKHIELDLYFVCEKVLQKQLKVHHLPMHDQLADGFTKLFKVLGSLVFMTNSE